MRFESRNKFQKSLFAVLLTGIMAISVTVFAQSEIEHDYDYGPYVIGCHNKITKKKVAASTNGAPDSLSNYVILNAWDKDGVCKVLISTHKKNGKATASKKIKNMMKAKSCHSLLDGNLRQVMPFNQQIVINTDR